MSEIIVIYDGKCELCKNSIFWIRKRLKISALDFHATDLSRFNLSTEQCSREVFVIADEKSRMVRAENPNWRAVIKMERQIASILVIKGRVSEAQEIERRIAAMAEVVFDEGED